MIDTTIIALFFAITLWIGIRRGRSIKTITEYAVSHRNYSTSILVATIFATLMGGGNTVGIVELGFKLGITYILVEALSFFFKNLFVAHFIAPRIVHFRDMISTGDMMASLYGKPARLITGLTAAIIAMGVVGIQVFTFAKIFYFFFSLPEYIGAMIGCGIIVFYSSFGGMKSVVSTDVFQFLIFIVMIPMVCNIGLNVIGGYEALFSQLPERSLTLFPDVFNEWDFLGLFLAYMLTLQPSSIQRLLMSKDVKQAKRSMQITALIAPPFVTIMGLTGFIALVLNPYLSPDIALPYLVDTIIPTGIKGLVVCGMFAAIMSTADSELNISGIAIVHDVVNPLLRKPMQPHQELLATRVVTFFIGSFAIFFALYFKNVIEILLWVFNFWTPVISVPLFAGIFSFRTTTRTFLLSGAVGATTCLLWNHFLKGIAPIDGLAPGTLANFITFSLCYIIENSTKRKLAHAPS